MRTDGAFVACRWAQQKQLENKQTFQASAMSAADRGASSGRRPHPVGDALVIYIQTPADLAHGVAFQVQLQAWKRTLRHNPGLRERRVATPAKTAAVALAARWGAAAL